MLNYIENFYGYGCWDSDYWFLGMEEGGNNFDQKLIEFSRITRSKNVLLDNYWFQKQFTPQFFITNTQSTWKRLIQILLFKENKRFITHKKDIQKMQFNYWGRIGCSRKFCGIKCNALIELLPLPAPNNSNVKFMANYQLKFSSYKQLKSITSKNDYKNYCWYDSQGPRRLSFIRDQIEEYSPKLVLLYGFSYLPEFSFIICGNGKVKWDFKNIYNNQKACFFKNNDTLFVCTYQPNGARNDLYWDKLSVEIEKYL